MACSLRRGLGRPASWSEPVSWSEKVTSALLPVYARVNPDHKLRIVRALRHITWREYVDTIVTTPSGGNVRDDVIFSAIAGIHYNLRNWWAFSINYHFATVQTDFTYMTDGLLINPSFVRHELLFGTRVAL